MKEIKQNSPTPERSLFLDSLRGFTVILMIIFHFSFDLNHFGIVQFDILSSPFWYFFPRLIVFLFLFAVGVALSLSHSNGINWKVFIRRLLLLVSWAAVISVVTYKLFPENWIYFGTLHSIAVCSLMALPFLKHPTKALLIGLCLFIPSIIWDYNIPFWEMPHQSWDYISPFPWVGASLFGIFAAHKGIHLVKLPENRLTKSLKYLGQHSLFIYLIHQPVLFGLLSLLIKIIHS